MALPKTKTIKALLFYKIDLQLIEYAELIDFVERNIKGNELPRFGLLLSGLKLAASDLGKFRVFIDKLTIKEGVPWDH